MNDKNATVESIVKLKKDVFLLKVKSRTIASKSKPGQFCNIKVNTLNTPLGGNALFRLKKTQKSIFDHDIYLPEHKVRALEKTRAGPFRHQILPFIDEEKFRRLCTIFVHCSTLMTRPARFS